MKRYSPYTDSAYPIELIKDTCGTLCKWEDVKENLKRYKKLNHNYKAVQQENWFLKQKIKGIKWT